MSRASGGSGCPSRRSTPTCSWPMPGLRAGIAAARAGHAAGRRSGGRCRLEKVEPAAGRSGGGAQLQRGLWRGQALAERILRPSWPSGSPPSRDWACSWPADRASASWPRDRAAGRPSARREPGGRTDVDRSDKACIRRSRLMVTTDSGPRFFAVAFGVPVISLFGPTDVAWTRTHYDAKSACSHAVPCGPCGPANLPAGASRLHAATLSSGACRRGRALPLAAASGLSDHAARSRRPRAALASRRARFQAAQRSAFSEPSQSCDLRTWIELTTSTPSACWRTIS